MFGVRCACIVQEIVETTVAEQWVVRQVDGDLRFGRFTGRIFRRIRTHQVDQRSFVHLDLVGQNGGELVLSQIELHFGRVEHGQHEVALQQIVGQVQFGEHQVETPVDHRELGGERGELVVRQVDRSQVAADTERQGILFRINAGQQVLAQIELFEVLEREENVVVHFGQIIEPEI